ncbi:hypothetical protein PIB30_076329 [Stylosanthes scabra]|uniref:Uncharacterized protein n=1 Tax=Stylosanthes scabra TaxID=79078 RepID=A0ABU6YP89_9FABA|nr:hypothetical protein [Stylosanthes scabra]
MGRRVEVAKQMLTLDLALSVAARRRQDHMEETIDRRMGTGHKKRVVDKRQSVASEIGPGCKCNSGVKNV